MVAPAATPATVASKLHGFLARTLKSTEVRNKLAEQELAKLQ